MIDSKFRNIDRRIAALRAEVTRDEAALFPYLRRSWEQTLKMCAHKTVLGALRGVPEYKLEEARHAIKLSQKIIIMCTEDTDVERDLVARTVKHAQEVTDWMGSDE